MIQKQSIAQIVLVIALLAGFSSFALTPLGGTFQAAELGFSLIGFGLFAFYFRAYPKVMRGFALLFVALFIQSVFSSNSFFQQSYKESLIASTGLLSVGLGLFVYFVCLRYRLQLTQIYRLIRIMAWVSIVILFFLFLSNTQFVTSDEHTFGVQALRKGLINFTACVYLLRYFQEGKIRFLIFNIILMSANHWDDFQRIMFFIYLLSFALVLYHFRRYSSGARLLIGVFILVPLLSIFVSTTQFGKDIAEKVESALELFDSDKEDYSDDSVEARIIETEYAIKGIQKSPIFGTGRMKKTNVEKFTGLSYFYVTDIGIIGILFCFGITGIFILLLQYRYWLRNYIRHQFSSYPNAAGAKIYLLMILLHTLFSGLTIFTPAEFMLMVAFIEMDKFQQLTYDS